MTLLSDYLAMHGVSVTWKHKTGNDGDDDIYTTSTIKVLWAFRTTTVRTIQGDNLKCQAICVCDEKIVSGDVITKDGRDWPVLGPIIASEITTGQAVALG